MQHILRTPICQYQAFIEPLAIWLQARGMIHDTADRHLCPDIGLEPAPGRITVERLECERDWSGQAGHGRAGGHRAADDRVAGGGPLGRVDDRAAAEAARQFVLGAVAAPGLAKDRPGFDDPDLFFGDAVVSDSRWITFTVTTTGDEFIDQITALTGSEPGRGGLVMLKDFGLGIVALDLPPVEIIGQPEQLRFGQQFDAIMPSPATLRHALRR